MNNTIKEMEQERWIYSTYELPIFHSFIAIFKENFSDQMPLIFKTRNQ